MEPYYSDESVTLYHGDCRKVLPTLTADAVITDPPYGISDAPITTQGRTGKRTGAVNTWHAESTWDRALDPEWMRLCGQAAPVVAWFGQWRKREQVAAAMPHPLRAEIVWAKDCHVGPPAPVAARDERIWLFAAAGIKGRTFETSVWDVPIIPTWAMRDHKNEKPLPLMRRLVRFLTDAGQVILDPFAGSGSTLRAAKDEGRRAIGVEIDERYCEIAARRLDQGVLDFEAVT